MNMICVTIATINLGHKYRPLFARLVKPDDIKYEETKQYFSDLAYKAFGIDNKPNYGVSNIPQFVLTGQLNIKKEESKMDIENMSKENIREAVKQVSEEKRTKEVQAIKSAYYNYLNKLDELNYSIKEFETQITCRKEEIEKIKKEHPEFSKKVIKG